METCKYCRDECRTAQGLRSHLTQSTQCRDKHFEEYAGNSDSSAETESESDSNDGLSGSPDAGGIILGAGDVEMDFSDTEETHLAIDPPRAGAQGDLGPPNVVGSNANAQKRPLPRPTVEEVEDEDERWVQPFPVDRKAGAILERCTTQFQKLREEQKRKGHAPWGFFESEDEWEFAQWLMTSGLSHKKIDQHLRLKTVRTVD